MRLTASVQYIGPSVRVCICVYLCVSVCVCAIFQIYSNVWHARVSEHVLQCLWCVCSVCVSVFCVFSECVCVYVFSVCVCVCGHACLTPLLSHCTVVAEPSSLWQALCGRLRETPALPYLLANHLCTNNAINARRIRPLYKSTPSQGVSRGKY